MPLVAKVTDSCSATLQGPIHVTPALWSDRCPRPFPARAHDASAKRCSESRPKNTALDAGRGRTEPHSCRSAAPPPPRAKPNRALSGRTRNGRRVARAWQAHENEATERLVLVAGASITGGEQKASSPSVSFEHASHPTSPVLAA